MSTEASPRPVSAVPANPTQAAVSPTAPVTPVESALDDTALRDQLAETREEIVRVDGKASIVLAGAGVAVGTIVAGLVAGDMKISDMSVAVLVTSILSAIATLGGIGCLGAAIYPRCGTPEPGRARYFAEVAAHKTAEALRLALAHDASAGDRLLHQLWGLSKAVMTKYILLRWGIRMLGLATIFGVTAGVLDAIG
jgi:hypothetical protein